MSGRVEAGKSEGDLIASPAPFLFRAVAVVPIRCCNRLRAMLVVLVMAGSMAMGPGAVRTVAQPQQTASWPAAVARGSTEGADEALLRTIYHTEAPVFRWTMRGADRSAYPVFIGGPVVAWGAWWIQGREDGTAAYRLTASQVAAYGAVGGLKALIRRPRPYAVLPDIRSRSPRYSPLGPKGDSFAFPSGHATMSFAMVTSLSLSHPEWYVIAPGAAWASAVLLSRVWLGVHYPSDVLVGAVLGAAIAVGVHLVAPSITPTAVEGGGSKIAAPMVGFRIRL